MPGLKLGVFLESPSNYLKWKEIMKSRFMRNALQRVIFNEEIIEAELQMREDVFRSVSDKYAVNIIGTKISADVIDPRSLLVKG